MTSVIETDPNIMKSVLEEELPNRHIEIYESLKRLSFIDHPLYHKKDAHLLLTYDVYKDENAFISKKKITYKDENTDLASFLPHLAGFFTLKQPAEQKLFLKLNYARYKAKELLNSLNDEDDFNQAQQFLNIAHETRNILVNHNLRLVVTIVKTFKTDNRIKFEDHISDGNMSVIRAVDHFDVGRGYKFSTYLVYALRFNYWRSMEKRKKDLPFAVSISDEFSEQNMPASKEPEPYRHIHASDHIKLVLDVMDSVLDDRQRKVIYEHFGLKGHKKKTLKEIGDEIHRTREAVRLCEMKALSILRAVLNGGPLPEP